MIDKHEHRGSVVFTENRKTHIDAKIKLCPRRAGFTIAFVTRFQNSVAEIQEGGETIRANRAVKRIAVGATGI